MKCLVAYLCLSLFPALLPAAVFPHDTGIWPKTWPQELEPLRESSRTLDIGTGIQQHIYEIPIPDKITFDKVWPVILKLRTPGSPISLYRHQSAPPKMWGDLLSNQQPTIRIYAPSGGISIDPQLNTQVGQSVDYNKLIAEGKAIKADAPWPKYLLGKNGELPEYVVSEMKDGRFHWVPADPADNSQAFRGFFCRARVDVELVVDGQVIDLNWIKLPADAAIQDHRFDAIERPAEEQPVP